MMKKRVTIFTALSLLDLFAALFQSTIAGEAFDDACNSASNLTGKHACRNQGSALIQAKVRVDKHIEEQSFTRKERYYDDESSEEEESSSVDLLDSAAGGGVHFHLLKDVEYDVHKNGGGWKTNGNLLYPKNCDPPTAAGWPAIILMFGLGSRKEYMDNIGTTMMGVSTGAVIFNPKDRDYDALKGAFVFLKETSTATTYNIDTSKITILGISWGGNILASLLMFDRYINENAYGIVLAAAYIMRKTHYHPDRIREWAKKDITTWPPVLAIHCENDNVAPIDQVFELFNVMDHSRIGWIPCPWDDMKHAVKGKKRHQKEWFAREVFKFMTRKDGSLFDESTSLTAANKPQCSYKSRPAIENLGHWVPATSIENLRGIDDIDQCEAICDSHPLCQSFVYGNLKSRSTRGCWFSTKAVTSKDKPGKGVDSGLVLDTYYQVDCKEAATKIYRAVGTGMCRDAAGLHPSWGGPYTSEGSAIAACNKEPTCSGYGSTKTGTYQIYCSSNSAIGSCIHNGGGGVAVVSGNGDKHNKPCMVVDAPSVVVHTLSPTPSPTPELEPEVEPEVEPDLEPEAQEACQQTNVIHTSCGNVLTGMSANNCATNVIDCTITTPYACKLLCDAHADCNSFALRPMYGCQLCRSDGTSVKSSGTEIGTEVYSQACAATLKAPTPAPTFATPTPTTQVPTPAPTSATPTPTDSQADCVQLNVVHATCGNVLSGLKAKGCITNAIDCEVADPYACKLLCDAHATCNSFALRPQYGGCQLCESDGTSVKSSGSETGVEVYTKACGATLTK